MIPDTLKKHLQSTLAQSCQSGLTEPLDARLQRAHGGDINSCFTLHWAEDRFFVKLNRDMDEDFFSAEAAGLKELQRSRAIRVPALIAKGEHEGWQYLILEHLDFSPSSNDYALGQALAKMHRFTCEENQRPWYGFTQDNYIGRNKQVNTKSSSWAEFWENCRLLSQFELAYKNGFKTQLAPSWQPLKAATRKLLQAHTPAASLLHGDLWGGNKGFIDKGTPTVFDPAVYYGDRETDLAMTELFGGFSGAFYQGYNSIYPLDDAYTWRKTLYNLYHQLNHLNLFGSSYLPSCTAAITAILALQL